MTGTAQQTTEIGAGGYTPFLQLSSEISKAQEAGAVVAALAMVYIGVDTMALMACPLGQLQQGKRKSLSRSRDYHPLYTLYDGLELSNPHVRGRQQGRT